MALSCDFTRSSVPDLPGMAEAGLPQFAFEFRYGFFVPAGTPHAIVRNIFDAAAFALQQPAVSSAGSRRD